MKRNMPTFVAAIAAGAFGYGTQAHAEVAKPFLLPIKCSPGFIPVSIEKGCIRDRTEEIALASDKAKSAAGQGGTVGRRTSGTIESSAIVGSATVATRQLP